MISLYKRDKNLKPNQESLLPYEKDEAVDGENNSEKASSTDRPASTEGRELSGSDFLLSYAGMFSSGETDNSERIDVCRAYPPSRKVFRPHPASGLRSSRITISMSSPNLLRK
jgi:hypothetical protein